MRLVAIALGGVAFFSVTTLAQVDLVVHAWSVFTTMQDENGKQIAGINVDDIPVPETLHTIAPGSLLPVGEGGETTAENARAHAEITTRLEKAVVKFYSAAGSDQRVWVKVGVDAGWITQFFPKATVRSEGFTRDHVDTLTKFSRNNGAEWSEMIVHPSADEMSPARIDVAGEEAEGLVYRGVANERLPFRIVRDGAALVVSDASLNIPQLWLLEVRANGAAAFRVLRPFSSEPPFVMKTSSRFADDEFSADAVDALASQLREAILHAGLFETEADALLTTLATTNFQRVGMRVIFVRPKGRWDSVLIGPSIHRSVNGRRSDVKATAATAGCIEIVTSAQRAVLRTISAGGSEQIVTGQPRTLQDLTDADWQRMKSLYDSLGQFRNALILDEAKRRSTPILAEFIRRFHLEAYRPKKDSDYFIR